MKIKRYSKKNIEIQSSPVKKEKKKKTGLIIVFFIIFLMAFSVIASVFFFNDNQNNDPDSTKYDYNGFSFINTQDGWQLESNGIIFEYLPNELENIDSSQYKYESAVNKNSFIIFDTKEIDQNDYLFHKLASIRQLGYNYFPACKKEEECGDLPIKKCEKEDIEIQITEKENSVKTTETGCVIIKTTKEDTIKVINKYIYLILGLYNEN